MLPDKTISEKSAWNVNPLLIGKTITNREKVHQQWIDQWEVRGTVDGLSVFEEGFIDHEGSKSTKIDIVTA